MSARILGAGLSLLVCPNVLLAQAFTCPAPGEIELGVTTVAEIEEAYPFGYEPSTLQAGGVSLDTRTYSQTSSRNRLAVNRDVTPSRVISLNFDSGVVVGYSFVSSFADDATDFDETRVGELDQGSSTRADVEALLGSPCGRYKAPLVAEGNEAYVYAYAQVKARGFNIDVYTETLIVTFDSGGVVTDVSLSTSGTP